jgi:hypothetical protein
MKPRWVEGILAVLAAGAFVLLVDAYTGETAPLWDGKWYVQLAEQGYAAPRMAPFAYRPGMPLLARWLAAASGLELEASFKLVGRCAAALVLCCAYAGARTLGAAVRPAAFVALVVGLCYHHVRFPLFFWSLVDVGGYALVLLAFWWLWKGWTLRAGLVGAGGLLFKEMLLIPWAVSLLASGSRARRQATKGPWIAFGLTAALGLALFLLPRLFLRVDHSQQWIDPLHKPETIARLWEAPASFARCSTLFSAYLVYWMPTFLLVTPARLRALLPALRPHAPGLVLYMGLLFLLALYGGDNIAVFVSYSVAAQVLVLALLVQVARLEPWECAGVLVCLFFFQHFHRAIPDPAREQEAYLVFYGFGTPSTNARRLLQGGAWLAAMVATRVLVGCSRSRAAP